VASCWRPKVIQGNILWESQSWINRCYDEERVKFSIRNEARGDVLTTSVGRVLGRDLRRSNPRCCGDLCLCSRKTRASLMACSSAGTLARSLGSWPHSGRGIILGPSSLFIRAPKEALPMELLVRRSYCEQGTGWMCTPGSAEERTTGSWLTTNSWRWIWPGVIRKKHHHGGINVNRLTQGQRQSRGAR